MRTTSAVKQDFLLVDTTLVPSMDNFGLMKKQILTTNVASECTRSEFGAE